jgi:hypothetical protein
MLKIISFVQKKISKEKIVPNNTDTYHVKINIPEKMN